MTEYQFNRVWEILVTETTKADESNGGFESRFEQAVVTENRDRANALANKYFELSLSLSERGAPSSQIEASKKNARYYANIYKDLVEQVSEKVNPATKQTGTRESYSEKSLSLTDIDFSLKTDASSRNSHGGSTMAVLNLYNLKPETEATIAKVNNLVRVRAGYGDLEDAGIVYTGTVTSARTRKAGPDRVTSLYLKESAVVMDSVRAYLAIPPAERLVWGDVIDRVATLWNHFGVNITERSIVKLDSESLSIDERRALRGGFSFSGFLGDMTSHLCDQINYVWYIDRNILHMHPRDFYRLPDDYGLDVPLSAIKSVEQVESQSTGITSRQSEPGVDITMFLDSDIQTGSILNLPELPDVATFSQGQEGTGKFEVSGDQLRETTELAFRRRSVGGLYTVRSVTYDLYTRGAKWDVNVVADKVSEPLETKDIEPDTSSLNPAIEGAPQGPFV